MNTKRTKPPIVIKDFVILTFWRSVYLKSVKKILFIPLSSEKGVLIQIQWQKNLNKPQ